MAAVSSNTFSFSAKHDMMLLPETTDEAQPGTGTFQGKLRLRSVLIIQQESLWLEVLVSGLIYPAAAYCQ